MDSPAAVAPGSLRSRRGRALALGSLACLCSLGLPARAAEAVLEQAAKTGEVLMVGPADSPPLIRMGPKGEPEGYAIDLARRIDRQLKAELGESVRIRFAPVDNTGVTVEAVASGRAGLACGVPFSWEREKLVDFSLPIGLSGLRLLTRSGGLDGSPASLAGQPIAVVEGSLGAGFLGSLQPSAKAVSFPTLPQAVTALEQKKVAGVLGDANVLAGLRHERRLSGVALVPEQPYVSYGVGCIVPENNSRLLNVVNLAIASLFQGYLEGRPDAVASVAPWFGPTGVLAVPSERMRAFFESVLISREGLQLVAPAPAPRP
ncbi:extracellular substrate binding-like orphan protein GrrP [Cyanobium gracile]|uniref:Periplasmic component of amino acid ABC-type transporter/signal transduction system n=1 Tax=Cyanobium gracile (strain ATCC 27147 / PCC 6307) TaxID=292564 RepID=K9P945_CYAGP|nr:extracellular substrate binding-like orphan protein GrrP [Cyanobium gracile]AFY29902.1 periplasmic component of amino acid ABC-type transporter/signal transduction system [Cyanobium gracile PCC 6307]